MYSLNHFRVSDRGGGIPHHLMSRVLDYNFTTAFDFEDDYQEQEGFFSDMIDQANPNPSGGPMHG